MSAYTVSTSQFNGVQLPCVRDDENQIVAAGCTSEDARLFAAAPKMLEALRAISLCSQNSASSKAECGRIAREAIESIGGAA